MTELALQDKYGASGICFGCGPANPKGLQIKTFVQGDEYIVKFHPKPEHQAFEGVINGGIIGSVSDCHCNTELLFKVKVVSLDGPKATVTGELLANDKVTALCEGVFVAVEPGHPGYHRWD